MDVDTYLKVAVEKIKSHFNPEKIILFGSYAYGHPTVDSDIDLMVVMDTKMEPYERALCCSFFTYLSTKMIYL